MAIHPTVIGIDAIASGSRMATRMRWGSTNTTAQWVVSATYLEKPLVGELLCSTGPLLPMKAGTPNPTSLTAGSPAWANGAWVEIRPAGSVAYLLSWYLWRLTGGTISELDFGIGSAGNEVLLTTVRHQSGATLNYIGHHQPLWNPPTVPVSTRLAGRVRCSTASEVCEVGGNLVESVIT